MKFGKEIKLNERMTVIRFAIIPTEMTNGVWVWLERYKDVGYYFYGKVAETVWWVSECKESI